ncbi:phytoene synthase [Pseudoclavibacter sp. RFBI5]|uniref:phytoene/squalene synthase family protein n=1 Tax=Pseudoclavibacter sp. RFBI5 TaxID=2080578 RepID=UPI000CE8A26B|nr:phytoene/squalene synthase family protein [Pseudoclavibacter sp. RFBI5]PPG04007.1 phytoene synthase [Pseudoclavibacter sp. RFBI5]
MMSPLEQYTRTAEKSAAEVIFAYSSSFGAASRFLGRRTVKPVRSIYALVRVADEIVDGVGALAGLSLEQQHAALDGLEAQTLEAIESGFSTNLVVHAFAVTARRCGFGAELVVPFFASMRMDLEPRSLDVEEQRRYVYGSAEVVGLMCVRVFLTGVSRTPEQRERIDAAACALGAAFQNVNFLRDVGDDADRLGRDYLPVEGLESAPLDERRKLIWLDRIRADLATAEAGIPLLPRDCRRGVALASALFVALADRIAETPADQLRTTRVRVPGAEKARIAARVLLETRS